MVIHRRLRLVSYRRTDTEDEFTQTRVTNNRSVTSSSSPRPPRLSLTSSFPLSFSSGRDAASVWQDWQVARSFRSASFCSMVRIIRERRREKEIERERVRTVGSRRVFGGLQTSRIRQIQLTRTELNRRNPSAGQTSSSIPPLSLRYPLLLRPLSDRLLHVRHFHHPLKRLDVYSSRISITLSIACMELTRYSTAE